MLISAKTLSRMRDEGGFTLIELMIVVAIVAILAAVAIPNYTDYVIRGQLVNATNAMSALRMTLEQYYQDNRTYLDVSCSGTAPVCSPCDSGQLTKTNSSLTSTGFAISCSASTATTYTINVTSTSTGTKGAQYTLDNNGNQVTVSIPTKWGTTPSSNACWITKRGMTC
jgi:type IV pilus assembly protein PilE